VSIGTTNASSVGIGHSGVTTTNNGALTVTQLLTANGGATIAANQNLTLQNGSGVFAQTYASSSASSAQTLSATNSNSGGSSVAVNAHDITLVGTATSGGTNTNSAIKFEDPSAAANNLYYGLNFAGTGYTDVLRVNSSQIISGAGVIQNAGFSSGVTYSNITKVGTLTAGALGAGFTTVAVGQGGTGATSFTSNGVLYGNNTGAVQATAAGTNGQCLVGNTGAAPSWSTCTGLVTLQNAYNNGNTISTSSNDIAFTLNSSDNFTVATAAGGTGSTTFSLTDGSNATPPAQLVLVRNNDTNQVLASGLKVTSAAGGITTALDVSGSNITNAIALGANAITGTNFSVTGGGAVTAVGVNSGTGLLQGTGGLTLTGATSINASGSNATNIGTGTNAGTITIGNASTGDLALNDANWSVTGAGLFTTSNNIAVNGGQITSTGTLTLDATSTVIIPNADTLQSDDLTSTGALTLTSAAANNIALNPGTTGDIVLTHGNSSNLQINGTETADNTINLVDLTLTNNSNASTGTLYALNVNNADNSTNTGVADGIARFVNNQGTETLTDGVLIQNSAGSGTMTSGLRVSQGAAGSTTTSGVQIVQSAGTLTNGLLLGGTMTNGIYFASATTTADIRKDTTGFTMDLNNASNSTLTVTNAGAGVASISLEAGGSYTGAGALTVSSGGSSGLTLDSASGRVTVATGDFLSLGVSGVSGAAAGDIWYDTAANKFKVNENGTTKTLCNLTDLGCGAGATTPLQQAYADDADGGNATISLTSADDSLVFTNPTSSGTDSAFLLQLTQQNTTAAVSVLDMTQSSNNANAVNLTANSIDGETALAVAANGLTTGKGISVTSTGTGLTTGSLLHVSSATTGAVNTNGIVSFQATGNYTSTSNNGLVNALANSTTAGTIVNIQGTSLTSGTALNIAANTGTAINVSSGLTSLTGPTSGSGTTLTVSNSTSTGSIAIFKDNSTAVATIADGGATTFQNLSDGTNAFRILRSGGGEVLGADTTGSNIRLLNNNTGTIPSGGWTTNGNALPAPRYGNSATTANGYVYVTGGADASDVPTNTVYYAKLNASGSIGSWSTTTVLPAVRNLHSTIAANGYLYTIGGNTTIGGSFQSTVYYAKINQDGTVGTWNTTSTISGGIGQTGVVTANGYLYIIGGRDGAGAGSAAVYYAKLNADGTIGSWTSTNGLGTDRLGHTSVVANGYIYAIGGEVSGVAAASVQYAKLNADGTVGTWSTSSQSLPDNRNAAAGVVLNGYIYHMGGNSATSYDTVYYAQIGSAGDTGAWTATTSMNAQRRQFAAVAANGYMYGFGGEDGTHISSVEYAGTSRVTIGGGLDLVNLSGENLADGSSGGQLTAGDTNIIGNLNVTGSTTFKDGISLMGVLSLNGSTNSTAAFAIQNAAASTIFSVDTANSIIKVNGAWQGNTSTTTTSDSAVTSTITTPALAYYVSSTDTTGVCGTGASKTFNITGIPNTEGTFAYIVSKAIDGGCATGTLTVTVQINGGTVSTVSNADTGGTVSESYTVAYINGTWRIVGYGPGAAGNTTVDTADLAEWIHFTGAQPTPGELLTIGDSDVSAKKSSVPYDEKVIGVVTTTPHTVMGADDGHSVVMALSGRVPVKVSLENGPIHPGDYLTTSSVPGVAMKATKAGRAIGVALMPYDGTGSDLVMTQLQVGFADPGTDANHLQGDVSIAGNLNISGNLTIDGDLTVAGTTTTKDLVVTGTAKVASITVGDKIVLGSSTEDPEAAVAHPIVKRFKASKSIAAGSVVILDAVPGWVTTTTTTGDTRVIGVAVTSVSTGGIVEVAIGGTAKVAVTGTPAIGQMLHADGIEGKASATASPVWGEIIGKVLGPPDADGTVLLLMTLQ
ncbi:MAG TPA: hypothetical protein VLE73_00900, partial [Candidatus Saccharimonadales bacterium]|nr:hypothetical protein [Candidatus Saccharimonadales bacterium]